MKKKKHFVHKCSGNILEARTSTCRYKFSKEHIAWAGKWHLSTLLCLMQWLITERLLKHFPLEKYYYEKNKYKFYHTWSYSARLFSSFKTYNKTNKMRFPSAPWEINQANRQQSQVRKAYLISLGNFLKFFLSFRIIFIYIWMELFCKLQNNKKNWIKKKKQW